MGNSGEVVVSSNSITVFNRDRSKKRTLMTESNGQCLEFMCYITGIALTHDNHLLVVDGDNHRVQMFTLEGKFIKSVGRRGIGRQLQFQSPRGITVDPTSHQVFIADTGNHRIQVLNNDLTYSHEFGRKHGELYLNSPVDVACDSNSNLYVVATRIKHVLVYRSKKLIGTISTDATPSPRGITIDSMNTVYVTDGYTVSMFNSKGQFLKCFESTQRQKKKH